MIVFFFTNTTITLTHLLRVTYYGCPQLANVPLQYWLHLCEHLSEIYLIQVSSIFYISEDNVLFTWTQPFSSETGHWFFFCEEAKLFLATEVHYSRPLYMKLSHKERAGILFFSEATYPYNCFVSSSTYSFPTYCPTKRFVCPCM